MSSDAERATGATRQGTKSRVKIMVGADGCLPSVSPASPLLSAPRPPRGPGITAATQIKKPAVRRALAGSS